MKKNVLNLVFLCAVFAFGNKANAQTVYFSENFSSVVLPAGWNNDSLGFPATHLWVFNNPFSRNITGANFDANFAMFDSDEGANNDQFNENASLTTNAIDLSAASGSLYLLLDQQYRNLAGPGSLGSSRRIETTIDGGITWNTLVYDSAALGYPTAIATSYDISSLAGFANVKIKFTWTGSYDWWWAIDNLKIQDQTDPCAGITLAGTITADSSVICMNGNINLTFVSDTSASNIPVQWQQSADGVNYTIIPGANSNTYTAPVSSTTYFSVLLNCGLSNVNVDPTIIIVNPTPTCYCYPVSPICGGTDRITNVSLNTLVNTSTCDTINQYSGYNYYPASLVSTNITVGQTYTLSVTTTSDNIISVWIDYNRNNVYEASEWKQICTTSAANVANTVAITVPALATPGLTGMRIRSRGVSNPNGATDACVDFFSGISEDYEISILDTVTSVHNVSMLKNIAVYPTITSDFVNLNFNQMVSNMVVSVFDIAGNKLSSQNIVATNKTKVDLSAYANGLYFIQLNNANEQFTAKVVLQK